MNIERGRDYEEEGDGRGGPGAVWGCRWCGRMSKSMGWDGAGIGYYGEADEEKDGDDDTNWASQPAQTESMSWE